MVEGSPGRVQLVQDVLDGHLLVALGLDEALGGVDEGLTPESVSVKAKSPEGLGLIGRREGIAAMAVVSLEVRE